MENDVALVQLNQTVDTIRSQLRTIQIDRINNIHDKCSSSFSLPMVNVIKVVILIHFFKTFSFSFFFIQTVGYPYSPPQFSMAVDPFFCLKQSNRSQPSSICAHYVFSDNFMCKVRY